MKTVDGGVCAPRGFAAAGVAAGVKLGTERLDCALVVSAEPASAAGVFTRNVVKAAPVLWCQDACAGGRLRAVFVNSGNANACTGPQGLQDAATTAEAVAEAIGCAPLEVAVCSTGVIGVPLPMDRILPAIETATAAAAPDRHEQAARAIMTTDTVPKETAVEVALSGGTARIGAMAKGSGMIAPNMATMLAFLTTDAAADPAVLRGLLTRAVDKTFNCISVDNDTSTNDTVLLLANGQSETAPLLEGGADHAAFAEALDAVCADLAKRLVDDGEGATKRAHIVVQGAPDGDAAKAVARAIAHSQLCKTAFFGEDPNWGRIACAAGYAGAAFDPDRMSIHIGGVTLMRDGTAEPFDEAEAKAVMAQREFTVTVDLGAGSGEAAYWSSDLSYDYVRINADYRT